MYILPSVSVIRYSTALKTEAVRLYCTETTVNLYQTVRLAFQRTVLFITLHPIIKIRRYLLLFRGNNFVSSEKVIRVTSTAFEGVLLLLLSIVPRWLMPRMYCSHIGLLYYSWTFQISPLVSFYEVLAARGGDVYEHSYFRMFQLSSLVVFKRS